MGRPMTSAVLPPRASPAEIVAWCENGPSSADVEDVTVEDETPEGLTSFEVR